MHLHTLLLLPPRPEPSWPRTLHRWHRTFQPDRLEHVLPKPPGSAAVQTWWHVRHCKVVSLVLFPQTRQNPVQQPQPHLGRWALATLTVRGATPGLQRCTRRRTAGPSQTAGSRGRRVWLPGRWQQPVCNKLFMRQNSEVLAGLQRGTKCSRLPRWAWCSPAG